MSHRPDVVRALLVTARDRPSAIEGGSSLRAIIKCFSAHIGWRDDDPANRVAAPRTVEHPGGP
jgi:hypothetical protein